MGSRWIIALRAKLAAIAVAAVVISPFSVMAADPATDNPVLNPESCSPFSEYPAQLVERAQRDGFETVEPLPSIYFVIRRSDRCAQPAQKIAFQYGVYSPYEQNYFAVGMLPDYVLFRGFFGMMGVSTVALEKPSGSIEIGEGQMLPPGLYRFVRKQEFVKNNGFKVVLPVIARVE